MRNRERIERNKVSLNIVERRNEIAEADAMQKERNKERRERFAELANRDAENLSFFRLTLDDLAAGKELERFDPMDDSGDSMRRATDETAALDDTPEWPSRLDPVKREAIAVVTDLVDITENARMAGLLKPPASGSP